MADISDRTVAILATNGFEQSELESPLKALKDAGATVHVIAPEGGEIKGCDGGNWGNSVKVDKTLSDVNAADYDALVLPGGQINPDILRTSKEAVAFVRAFWDAKKPIGAICHAPWMLIEADIIKGRNVTSYHSIRKDVENAGGIWQDSEVVCDTALVTSRDPDDLPAFNAKMIEEIAEGKHRSRAA